MFDPAPHPLPNTIRPDPRMHVHVPQEAAAHITILSVDKPEALLLCRQLRVFNMISNSDCIRIA